MITIIFDSKPTSVLCHMGDFGCWDGGWTPGMKMEENLLSLLILLKVAAAPTSQVIKRPALKLTRDPVHFFCR